MGTVVASKTVTVDANKDVASFRNITLTGELDAGSLDVSGDADIDGTLEADAITVNGSSLSSVIAGTTVANATLSATTTVTDSTANTNFPVVFHDESNALLDDTGALRYNPSSGTLLVPNLSVAGTTTTVDTVTMEASNAIIFEGATADAHESTLTIIDPTADRTINLPNQSGTLPVLAVASTTQITSTPEELNILDGATVVVGEINALDLGSTAVGTAIASKAVILDSNKDYTGIRNITITVELDAGSLDISGDADIDGTLETDALTIGGVTLAETISDTTGAMFSSNTETGITATYEDGDNTIDLAIDASQTTITSITNTSLVIGRDADNDIDFATDNNIIFRASGADQIKLQDGALLPVTDNDIDLGSDSLQFKDAHINGTLEADAITIAGVTLAETISDTTGAMFSSNTETGITATYQDADNTIDLEIDASMTSITSLVNSSLEIGRDADNRIKFGTDNQIIFEVDGGDNVIFKTSGEIEASSLDISGDVDVDGTLEADAVTIDGTALAEVISDTTGAMFSSNTETGITATYQDADNTIDLALDASQTTITSLLATDIKIGEDDETKIDFETADEIHFYANNVEQVYLADNIFGPQSDSDVDLGSTSVRWKDAYIDTITTTGALTVGGNGIIGDGSDIDPDSSGSGQLKIDGNGYTGYVALNGTAMNIGHNSSARNLVFQTNETTRMTIDNSDAITIGQGMNLGTLHTDVTTGTGATEVFDITNTAPANNTGDGIYLFNIVRRGGSYSSRFVGIFGVDNGGIALINTIENNDFTISVSGMSLRATTGSSINCTATLQPLAIGD